MGSDASQCVFRLGVHQSTWQNNHGVKLDLFLVQVRLSSISQVVHAYLSFLELSSYQTLADPDTVQPRQSKASAT